MPTPQTHSPTDGLEASAVRARFPIFTGQSNLPLVYLDSAATTQKPDVVLDAIARYYREINANVHRGVHRLSVAATDAYEKARERVARFVNAPSPRGVVFTRGTTEAVNLVAQSFTRPRLRPDDEILITHLEHHSNIVPWQIVAEQTGARLVVAPIDDRGDVILDEFRRLLTERTRLAAFAHVSNALGTVNPVQRMVEWCRERGVPTLIDGAQAVAHGGVDVTAIGCDFYALSGHKCYAPMGIGCLIAREAVLEAMPPYQGGGDMIASVTFEKTTYNEIPFRFEAGTPNVEGAVGLAAAIEFMESLGIQAIAAHEHDLLEYAAARLRKVEGVRLIGTPRCRAGAISFVLGDVHPHDVGTILDARGVAVRTGHHCAEPVMSRFDVPATVRASVGVYNTRDDIDALVEGLAEAQGMFA